MVEIWLICTGVKLNVCKCEFVIKGGRYSRHRADANKKHEGYLFIHWGFSKDDSDLNYYVAEGYHCSLIF